MTLEDLCGNNQELLEQRLDELSSIASMIDGLLAGKPIDPALARVSGLLLLSFSQADPELPDGH